MHLADAHVIKQQNSTPRKEPQQQARPMWKRLNYFAVCEESQGKMQEAEVVEHFGSKPHKTLIGEACLQMYRKTTKGAEDGLEAARGQQWFREGKRCAKQRK